jgi:uracil-DNA glycosylase family 4
VGDAVCAESSHVPALSTNSASACAARLLVVSSATASDPAARAEALSRYQDEHVVDCTKCPLSEGRTQVVIGNGDPDADIMFVGEAPGYHEDRQGLPFVGAAGQLLDRLLGEIALSRADVFVANVLKCRPPGNRDPQPAEISSCEPHLFRQISLIQPKVICTLGNFATKLLSGRPEGISRVHGHELPIEVAGLQVLLFPVFHPAAALRTRSLEESLREDFAKLPGLAEADRRSAGPAVPEQAQPAQQPADPATEQLGLF